MITRQNRKLRRGAALVLAVMAAVLLAAVGVVFVLASRLATWQTAASQDVSDLNAAGQAVIKRIQAAMVMDLFGENLDKQIGEGQEGQTKPNITYAGKVDDKRATPWLASLEPNPQSQFKWDFISKLSDDIALDEGVETAIIKEYPEEVADGQLADADGDGVSDSRWFSLGHQTSSRGKPIFAAVRIIDNCAMLNLNTAYAFYQQKPWHSKSWELIQGSVYLSNGDFAAAIGRYLTEANYVPFLRGADRNQNRIDWIQRTKGLQGKSPYDIHKDVLMSVEAPPEGVRLFDIGDELEIRNRYLLTSLTIGRFEREDVAYQTFDFGRGEFTGGWNVDLRSKRIPCQNNDDLAMWRIRLNPDNFDDLGNPANPYYYDRRHICTFYSFDRPLRIGQYPLLKADGLELDQRRKLMPEKAMPINLRSASLWPIGRDTVHLFYALREIFTEGDGGKKQQAARQAAQMIANIIDYRDENNEPTVFKASELLAKIQEIADATAAAQSGLDSGETFYGYEIQPFITGVFTAVDNDAGGVLRFAVELYNPYAQSVELNGWRITVDNVPRNIPNTVIPPQSRLVLCSHDPDGAQLKVDNGAARVVISGLIISNTTQKVVLERPLAAGEFLAVDIIPREYVEKITTDPVGGGATYYLIRRAQDGWKFANVSAYQHQSAEASNPYTLGTANTVNTDKMGYQLPVANDGGAIDRLADFLKVVFIGNQKGGAEPKTITQQIAVAENEGQARIDILSRPQVLDYLCFVNRPQGSLPGRININTAALHVIAAAIPPQLVISKPDDPDHSLELARQIVANRPYRRVSDLLNKVPALQKFNLPDAPNVGDALAENDFEQRDWIVSRLANIFTVRSDTFTAYIIVRLGEKGPQRRWIVIFDRTNVWEPTDTPRIVALHPVPDPR